MIKPDANATGPDNATLELLRSPVLAVALPAVYSLVVLVSVPGHLFALWVLCRHVGPRSPSAVLMIHLSLSDLMLAAVLPFQIAYHGGGHHWPFGARLCSAVTAAFYANMYASVLSVAGISVDRCLAVVRPLAAARWRRRRYAVAACLASWLLLAAALAPLARADLTYHVAALGIITCFDVLTWALLPGVAAWAAFLLALFVLLFLVPFGVTVGCYAAMIRTLLRRPAGAAHERERRRRAVGLAALVLLAFVLGFAPNNLALLGHVVGRLFLGRGHYGVYKLTLALSCLHNCLDPFVYYFASREFRRRLRGCLRPAPRDGHAPLPAPRDGHAPLPAPDGPCRESRLSARTLSARSTSAGRGDEPAPTGRQRQESVV